MRPLYVIDFTGFLILLYIFFMYKNSIYNSCIKEHYTKTEMDNFQNSKVKYVLSVFNFTFNREKSEVCVQCFSII